MKLTVGPYDLKGLQFPKALTIDPIETCARFLTGAKRVKGFGNIIEEDNDSVRVRSVDGNVLASGSHIFGAVGAGVRVFAPLSGLGLRYSRGQISMVEAITERALTYGGYAIPLGDRTLIGATHARLGEENPYGVTDADDLENLSKFEGITGENTTLIPGGSRASIRVTRANTLPMTYKTEYITRLDGLGVARVCIRSAFGRKDSR